MKRRSLLLSLPAAAFVPGAVWAASLQDKSMQALPSIAVYELRVYKAHEGKLDDLLRRFREHTLKLFEKHGMKTLAFWTPTDDPQKSNMLVYILVHPSRAAATVNWKAFHDDPEWNAVRDKSESNGPLVEKVDSTFLVLADFSPTLP
jgi:hypothetical protein